MHKIKYPRNAHGNLSICHSEFKLGRSLEWRASSPSHIHVIGVKKTESNMFVRLLIAVLCIAAAGAHPSGPGSCSSPNPLGSGHLNSGTSGALSKYGIVLKIGGKPVTPGVAFSLKAGKSLAITLSSTKTFKGFLIRISKGALNTVGYLKKGTDANTQVLGLCTNAKIGGISHNNSSGKTLASGFISVPTATTGLTLEVTVVVQNSSGKSVWYKSNYVLNAVASTSRGLRTADELVIAG